MSLESELAQLHRPLLRFAMLQLRNDSMAEDVVSETLLAILEKPERFAGRSSLRTYATGILKFKIIDVLRTRGREVHIEPLDEQSLDDALDALFAADDHWQEPPPAWQQRGTRARTEPVLRDAAGLRRPPAGESGPGLHDARVAGARCR